MKRSKIISYILILLLSAILFTSVSYAWFRKNNNTINATINGKLVTEYFHSGNGTKEDPFVITRPIHYCHMVEFFQRLTELSVVYDEEGGVVNFGDDYLYFQIGCTLEDLYKGTDISYDTSDTGYYVFNYNNAGDIQVVDGINYCKTLNMAYYSGDNALMPVGSSEVPFYGEIDGNYLTVSNLNIVTTTVIPDPSDPTITITRKTSDVGVFGYMSTFAGVDKEGNDILDEDDENVYSGIYNLYFDNLTIDLTDANAIVSCDDHTENSNHADGEINVGYIAGHIGLYTAVQNVYINNSKIIGGAKANSSFGYFGRVDNADGQPITSIGTEIATLRSADDNSGFGGSLDMMDIETRLQGVFSAGSVPSNYVSAETYIINEETGETTYSVDANGNINYRDTNYRYRYYESTYAGKYYFYQRSDNSNQYMCIYGESSRNPKTITLYTYKDEYLDCYFIQSNGQYLTVSQSNNPSIITNTNVNNATKWMLDENNHLYTIVEGDALTKYYLNVSSNVVTIQTGTNNLITWTVDETNDNVYCVISGYNYYLNYVNSWVVTRSIETYKIGKNNSNYLSVNNNTIVAEMNVNNASSWLIDNLDGDTTFSTYINGNQRYLVIDSNDKLVLSATVQTWTKDTVNNWYYITKGGINYYLIFAEGVGWRVIPGGVWKIITDGNGNFLNCMPNAVTNVEDVNSTLWQFENVTGGIRISTYVDGTKYYLNYNNGLVINTTPATWVQDGTSLYVTVNGVNYYLGYHDRWDAIGIPVGADPYFVIGTGSNYLVISNNGTLSNADSINQATKLTFSTMNGSNSSGYLSFKNGNQTQYVNINNGAISIGTSGNTSWSMTNDMVHSGDYYLTLYNGQWVLLDTSKYYIASGTNYLAANSNYNGLSNEEEKEKATLWTFSNFAGDGTVSVKNGNNTYYLQITTSSGTCGGTNYNLALSTSTNATATTWTRGTNGNNSTLKGQNNYYLRYNSGWDVNNSSSNLTIAHPTATSTATLISSDYISSNMIAVSVDVDCDSVDKTFDINSNNKDITPSTYQVYEKETENVSGGYQSYFPIKIATSDEEDWYDANDPYKVSMKNTGYIISGARVEDSPSTADNQKAAGDIRISYFAISNISSSYKSSNAIEQAMISYNNTYLSVKKEKKGNESVVVLYPETSKLKAAMWIFSTPAANPSGTISTIFENNVYYLVIVDGELTLSNEIDDFEWSDNNKRLYNGDSYLRYEDGDWTVGTTQTLTIAGGSFAEIYTVNASGRHTLTEEEETTVYKNASGQLLKTLIGSSSVYGIHFMDAAISNDYKLVADKAVILGNIYDDYELPLDAIDFNVVERGTISFFAGDYFTNNNTFFSLHQVFRSGSIINNILEISKVYIHKEKGKNVNYIYLYTNGDYSNADGTYTPGTKTLDSDYELVFDMSWVTSPPNMQSGGTHLYYFEIPCNAGEYALGSVSGKTGAYLAYLDIAANGGDVINSDISGEGNDIVNKFEVEVRSMPDVIEDGYNEVIQIAFESPEGCTKEDFAVSISYDKNARGPNGEYLNGIYTINVINKTSSTIRLYVYLCDDDCNLLTKFEYAYRIVYTNNSNTDKTIVTSLSADYWQVMAGFDIPGTGNAIECSYQTD